MKAMSIRTNIGLALAVSLMTDLADKGVRVVGAEDSDTGFDIKTLAHTATEEVIDAGPRNRRSKGDRKGRKADRWR